MNFIFAVYVPPVTTTTRRTRPTTVPTKQTFPVTTPPRPIITRRTTTQRTTTRRRTTPRRTTPRTTPQRTTSRKPITSKSRGTISCKLGSHSNIFTDHFNSFKLNLFLSNILILTG